MIVRRKGEVPVNIREDGVAMTDFFEEEVPKGAKVTMGYAVFPPGTVVPPSAHPGDEYSYIISGNVKCESGGVMYEMSGGDAGYIPAGEEHRSMNESDSDAALVWVLAE